MAELGISYSKSALDQGAMARQALTLETSGRSTPSTAFIPGNEITPCVMKISGRPPRKNGQPAAVNLCLRFK